MSLSLASLAGACGDDGDKSLMDTQTTSDVSDAETPDDAATPAEDVATADTSPAPDTSVPPQQPVGMVFVQTGGVGYASYHFDAPDNVYIDYTNAAGIGWRLDSGALPPAQKKFLNPVLDYENRRFTGTIDWISDPFAGAISWEYDMVFSADFGEISSGTLVTTFKSGEESTSLFGVNLTYRAATEENPHPFSAYVKCLTTPPDLDKVAFVRVFSDPTCSNPTDTTFALPVDNATPCCDGYNATQLSFSQFSCDNGELTFDVAFDLCAAEPTGSTLKVSADTCVPYGPLQGFYLRMMPEGGCGE